MDFEEVMRRTREHEEAVEKAFENIQKEYRRKNIREGIAAGFIGLAILATLVFIYLQTAP